MNVQTRSKQDETCTAEGYTTSAVGYTTTAVVSLPREGLVKLGGSVFADPGLLLGQLVWVRNDVHLQGIYIWEGEAGWCREWDRAGTDGAGKKGWTW